MLKIRVNLEVGDIVYIKIPHRNNKFRFIFFAIMFLFYFSSRKPKNTSDCVSGFIKEKFKLNIRIYS